MTEVAGDLMCRSVSPKEIDVDRATAARILFGEILVRDAHSNRGGIARQVPAHHFEIAESGRHEDIGPVAPSYEIASDRLAVSGVTASLSEAQHVLRGRGLVVQRYSK